MDFLNKTFAQAADLFRSMTPGARITAGLLAVLVVISLGYLFQHQTAGPDAFLMNGEPVPASCLPAMEAAFAKANLSTYTIDGARIRVPRGQQGAYMAALAEGKALPPNFGSALAKALDAGSMFESPEKGRERRKTALQEELSLILRSMNGIENAFVLFDTEPRGGLGNNEKLVTASVSVKPLGTENLDESRVSAIRYCVAFGIGAKPENVVVTDLNEHGRVYHGDLQNGGAGENQYLAAKQEHERVLKAKILDALSFISGLTVQPTVELDKERTTRTQSLKVDPKTVPLRTTEKSVTRTREGTSGGGRPGFQGQGNTPASLASAGAGTSKGSHEEEENSSSTAENVPVLREQIEKESVGLTPKRATVAVGVPSSYFEKVWRERNPVKEGEEPKTPDAAALAAIGEEVSSLIRKHVATLLTPLLPPEPEPDMTKLVTITTFQDIKPGAIPGPSTWQNVLAWLSTHWSTLGLIGLVLAGLAMLRSVVRGGGTEPATMSARIAATPEDAPAEKESAELVAARRLRRLAAGGPSLRDELSGLVTEDPDAAANILRTWIGQAG
jgi:flagellar M-ring protein FliF